MPNPEHTERHENASNIIASSCKSTSDIECYLDEAKRCFLANANNASIVMLWCAIIACFRQIVEPFGQELYQEECQKDQNEKDR
jgi:hypothetical protein